MTTKDQQAQEPLATPRATLMAEHRDYIDGYAAGLADGQRLAPQAGEVTDEQIERVARSHGTGGWQTLPDMIRFARAILALRPQAVPAEEESDFFVLDDQAKAMIVNSHHYTPGSIKALIERLKAFSDPEKTTQSDWDNLDWRGFCNVLWRVMMGLACDLSPQAVPMTDSVFDLICNAIDKAYTITMQGDYMMDSDDCIAVVRVMQALMSVRGIPPQAEGPV